MPIQSFDFFRGIGSRSNNIRSHVFFNSQATNDRSSNENEFASTVPLSLLAGGGCMTAAILLKPTLTGAAASIAAGNVVGLFFSGVLLVVVPTMFSIVDSLYTIGKGIFDNKGKFFASCGSLELLRKFMAIFTDPIVSLLSSLAQIWYGAVSLLFTLPCLLICDFTQAYKHLTNSGTAYLDFCAHLTSAFVTPLINFVDFCGSALASIPSTDQLNPAGIRSSC